MGVILAGLYKNFRVLSCHFLSKSLYNLKFNSRKAYLAVVDLRRTIAARKQATPAQGALVRLRAQKP
jgi:hypothetical protein